MSSITFERDGDVGVITLKNGELNFFGGEAFSELDGCIAQVESSGVRAAVWRAEGKVFSAGVDVQIFKEAADAGEGFPALVGPSSAWRLCRSQRLRSATASASRRDLRSPLAAT